MLCERYSLQKLGKLTDSRITDEYVQPPPPLHRFLHKQFPRLRLRYVALNLEHFAGIGVGRLYLGGFFEETVFVMIVSLKA